MTISSHLIPSPLSGSPICPPQGRCKCLCPSVTALRKACSDLPFPMEESQIVHFALFIRLFMICFHSPHLVPCIPSQMEFLLGFLHVPCSLFLSHRLSHSLFAVSQTLFAPPLSFSCFAWLTSHLLTFSLSFASPGVLSPGSPAHAFLHAPVQGLAQVLGLVCRCNRILLNLLLLCFIIEPAKHQHKTKDSSKWIIALRAAPKVSVVYVALGKQGAQTPSGWTPYLTLATCQSQRSTLLSQKEVPIGLQGHPSGFFHIIRSFLPQPLTSPTHGA